MRALAGLVAALAAVAVLRVILGPWEAALVVAALGVVALVCAWATFERRAFDEPPPPERPSGPVIDVSSRPAGPQGWG